MPVVAWFCLFLENQANYSVRGTQKAMLYACFIHRGHLHPGPQPQGALTEFNPERQPCRLGLLSGRKTMHTQALPQGDVLTDPSHSELVSSLLRGTSGTRLLGHPLQAHLPHVTPLHLSKKQTLSSSEKTHFCARNKSISALDLRHQIILERTFDEQS